VKRLPLAMSIYQFILSMILASDISVARPRRRLPIRKLLGWRHESHSGRGCLPLKSGARKLPIRLDVERMPSFAPSTAARSQPMRPVRCRSFLFAGIVVAFLIGEPPSHETPSSFLLSGRRSSDSRRVPQEFATIHAVLRKCGRTPARGSSG
jgi:hypothetical protein